MWSSLFSRDPTKDFPYDLLDKIFENADISIWTIFNGKKKGSDEYVTIFSVDAQVVSQQQVSIAKESIKKLKTLRHPNVLTYVDSLETDKTVLLVTERVVPLTQYLKECKLADEGKSLLISWGIFQLANALKFLSNDVKLVHNNVTVHTIFVNQCGDWKLSGFEYCVVGDGIPCTKPYGLQKLDAPEHQQGFSRRGQLWSTDMWGVGVLIFECFNGAAASPAALKAPKNIPKLFVPVYASLIAAPEKRPSPETFLEQCRKSGGFMKNTFVDSLLFLDEIQLKEPRERSTFFGRLPDLLDSFPDDISKNRILPQLIRAHEFGDAGAAILTPLFKVGKLLDHIEYQKKIVPAVVKLFSSNDRATRVKLLQQIDAFVDHLQPSIVNEKIFPSLVTGLMDSNAAVRESTVKAMVPLAAKLNYNNLNVELMKHLARIQSKDDQSGVRTNTTVCLGKIGSYLHPDCRQKILLSAFARALKDPFPPARSAGVLAFVATQQYYALVEVAQKVLPALCALLTDPEKTVRDQAFKAIRGFVEKLHRASDNPDLIAEMEALVHAGSSSGVLSGAVPSWAEWALGALSTKFYKGSSAPAGTPAVAAASAKTLTNASETSVIAVAQAAVASSAAAPEGSTTDGWDDDAEDWGTMEESPSFPDVRQARNVDSWQEDDTDEAWGSLEDYGEPSAPAKSTSTTNKDRKGSELAHEKNTTAPLPAKNNLSALKLPCDNSRGDAEQEERSGWEDDSWGDVPVQERRVSERKPEIVMRSQQRKQEVEEKRQQRQQGPMKLGVKRVT